MTSKWDLSKANNFIDVWITGLNEEIKSPGSSEPIDDLMSKFYDSSKKKVKKCKPTTGKCFFPFYIGIAEGATDLRKVFKMILDGALNQSNEGF